jgi:DNA-binding response OmpR family regulator
MVMPISIRDRAKAALEGEDLETTHWEDARHWMGVYADLLRFKVGLLRRVQQELPKLQPVARRAAADDLGIIEQQMLGYQARLDQWYARVWDLRGLWLDPQGQMIRLRGLEISLTKHEFQLLQFLLDHPHRFFTASQILDRAWGDPALFPEQVRNYVHRLRKVLAEHEIPAEVVNRRGRGYSLVLRLEV